MTPEEWSKIKYFRPHEFDSPDEPGSGIRMQQKFVRKLDRLRELCKFPFRVNSGMRTEAHNAEVGGVDSSAHTQGWAADIFCRTSSERFKILKAALTEADFQTDRGITVEESLFKRIGIGKTFVHLDADPSKPQNVIWLYD